jgi:hypothetical protein
MNHRVRDPYASPPGAYAAVAVGLAAVVFGTYAITTDWPVWAVAGVVFICAPAAALGAFTALGQVSAYREARGYYDQRRDAAYSAEQPPGAAEVREDLAGLRARLNIPAPRRIGD